MYEMQRKLAWSSLKTGIVITIAVLLLFITIFFSGNLNSLLSPKTTLFARIHNVQGLRAGAPVWLYGYEVGMVEEIRLEKSGAVIKMAINSSNVSTLNEQSVAMIMTMGILGDKYIEIDPGSFTGKPVGSGDTISGLSAIGFEKIIASTQNVMATLDSTLSALGSVLTTLKDTSGTLGKLAGDPDLYDNLNQSANALAKLTGRLSAGKGSLSMFVEDSSLYTNLNHVALDLSSILGEIGNGSGDGSSSVAGALFNDQNLAKEVHQTVSSLKNAAEEINKLVSDVRENPRKYFNFELF